MIEQQRPLADVMAQVAQRLDEPASVDEVLQRVLVSARDTIPGVTHAGITIMRREGRIETAASTGDIVVLLDQRQYELGEGPCVDAAKKLGHMLVEDFRTEPRWPRYSPLAVELGVLSQMGLELFAEEETLGALNLYGDVPKAFDHATPYIARLFATHAAHAMGKVIKQGQLNDAIESRTVIGQALGLVMAWYTLDEDQAFAFLKRLSQTSNIKLVEVATTLVAQANEDAADKNG